MNVKNSPCIRRLAIKTLKKSAKRNIIAVAAIVLTTLLITSIFSVAFSFITASRALDDRIAGCAADLYFDNINDKLQCVFVCFIGVSNDRRYFRFDWCWKEFPL